MMDHSTKCSSSTSNLNEIEIFGTANADRYNWHQHPNQTHDPFPFEASQRVVYVWFFCSAPLCSCVSGSPFVNIFVTDCPGSWPTPVFLLFHHLCRPQRYCSRAARPGLPTSGHSPRLIRHRGQGVRQAEVKRKQLCKCACAITSFLTSFRVWFACLGPDVYLHRGPTSRGPLRRRRHRIVGGYHPKETQHGGAGWYLLWLCIRRTPPPVCHVPITCTPSVMED